MATIDMNDLHPANTNLSPNSEDYLNELSSIELTNTRGGLWPLLLPLISAFISGMAIGAASTDSNQGGQCH